MGLIKNMQAPHHSDVVCMMSGCLYCNMCAIVWLNTSHIFAFYCGILWSLLQDHDLKGGRARVHTASPSWPPYATLRNEITPGIDHS